MLLTAEGASYDGRQERHDAGARGYGGEIRL
jgi:hypothetical protein